MCFETLRFDRKPLIIAQLPISAVAKSPGSPTEDTNNSKKMCAKQEKTSSAGTRDDLPFEMPLKWDTSEPKAEDLASSAAYAIQ
jgi:hypothetical protein